MKSDSPSGEREREREREKSETDVVDFKGDLKRCAVRGDNNSRLRSLTPNQWMEDCKFAKFYVSKCYS